MFWWKTWHKARSHFTSCGHMLYCLVGIYNVRWHFARNLSVFMLKNKAEQYKMWPHFVKCSRIFHNFWMKLLANLFVNTQFRYAHLIWMFTNKTSMLKVNKIHRRTIRVVYNDYNSTYEELLTSHNDISIHLKHLAIEDY